MMIKRRKIRTINLKSVKISRKRPAEPEAVELPVIPKSVRDLMSTVTVTGIDRGSIDFTAIESRMTRLVMDDAVNELFRQISEEFEANVFGRPFSNIGPMPATRLATSQVEQAARNDRLWSSNGLFPAAGNPWTPRRRRTTMPVFEPLENAGEVIHITRVLEDLAPLRDYCDMRVNWQNQTTLIMEFRPIDRDLGLNPTCVRILLLYTNYREFRDMLLDGGRYDRFSLDRLIRCCRRYESDNDYAIIWQVRDEFR